MFEFSFVRVELEISTPPELRKSFESAMTEAGFFKWRGLSWRASEPFPSSHELAKSVRKVASGSGVKISQVVFGEDEG